MNMIFLDAGFAFLIINDKNVFEPISFRWRASLWKSVWKQLLCYLFTFLAISLTYRSQENDISRNSLTLSYHRVILDDHSRITFEWVTPKQQVFIDETSSIEQSRLLTG